MSDSRRNIAIVVGTRPEAIKVAPIIAALERSGDFDAFVINSGQHRELIDQVIQSFSMKVARNLDVMTPNQGLSALLARLIERIDNTLNEVQPDMVLAQGDTSTALAAALASFNRRIPFGHVEAGLRTGNLSSPFPEEANRVLTTRISTLHFSPTDLSARNLREEGVSDSRVFVTGNTVVDALLLEVKRQQHAEINEPLQRTLCKLIGDDFSERQFVLITGHRRENFGEGFRAICDAIAELADAFPDHLFIYPVHLNPNVRGVVHDRLSNAKNIRLIAPVAYPEFVALLARCHIVLTDSGGIQEEAPSLGKPVLVMRDTTERPEGVSAGAVRIVGTDSRRIVEEVRRLLTDNDAYREMADIVNPYGDGYAAERIVKVIRKFFSDGAINA